IELKPEYTWAWTNRGIVYSKLRQYEQAVADHSEAIKLRPDLAESYVSRGFAHAKLGHYKEAIADYTRAIQLKPNYFPPWRNRGVVHSILGQWGQAIADYSQALKIGQPGDFAETGNALAWLRANCPDPRFRDAKQAVELAQKAVDLAPKNGRFWLT